MLLANALFQAIFVLRRADTAKKLLALYENNSFPQLTLDANGIAIPLIALTWVKMPALTLMHGKKMCFTISWKVIEEWKMGFRGSEFIMPPHYLLKIKDLPLQTCYASKKIYLRRDCFTSKDEKALVEFASRYLDVPIKQNVHAIMRAKDA